MSVRFDSSASVICQQEMQVFERTTHTTHKRPAMFIMRIRYPIFAKVVSVSVVLSALTACGTVNRVSVRALSEDEIKSAERGIVVFSVGARDSCTSFATGLYIEDEATGKRVNSVPAIFIDNSFQKSDFPDHHGMVDAISLAPGRYVLKAAVVNPTLITVKTPRAHFEIQAGEAIYLGELYMPTSCNMSSVTFRVYDRFDRDFAVIKQNRPELSTRPFVKHIMQFQ